jgi:hypothetical protein
MKSEAEVLIEMRRLGDSVRVSALCPVTGLEATVVGPAGAGEAALAEAASAKLRWLLRKRASGPQRPAPPRRGLLA